MRRFNLPPFQIARPLPVKQNTIFTKKDEGPKKRKRNDAGSNDTPRAFKRLMAYADGRKPRSGLDNGEEPSAKSKKNQKAKTVANADATVNPGTESKQKAKTEVPTIKPGERMSEFVARVDAALPLAGLITKSAKNGKDPLGVKIKRTKKERKMRKLYDEWREEDQKIKEQKEEDAELQAEKDLEDEEAGVSWKSLTKSTVTSGKKKKGKRAKLLDEVADDEEDPWEELKRMRGETRPGLHDVAKAPPELRIKPVKKITVRGATVAVDSIPKAAGSLRRREELSVVRNDIVAAYRKMMEGKKPSLRQPLPVDSST